MLEYFLSYLVISIYLLASIGMMFYGLHCYVMIFLFLKRQKKQRYKITEQVSRFEQERLLEDYPFVTIQLPIYNEAEVVSRLIESACLVDYPKNRYDIQILDDSTDETRGMVDQAIEKARQESVTIEVLRRKHRKEYKAGALAAGIEHCKGEYIAIFDADFVVPVNFLKRTVALIEDDDKLACVQGRWGHVNRKENWLTCAQSIGIDGHFTAEQGARSYSGLCMNFNGTAGLWRKTAIIEAGGWQGDTLTEDLDLSYRAQMKGYRISYDYDLECIAEIPNNVIALKNQQKRWAKGSIETSKKLFADILRCPLFSIKQKVEAFFHLTHYSVAIFMLTVCLLTLPMLWSVQILNVGWVPWFIWHIIMLSAFAPCIMYTGSGIVLKRGFVSFIHFPYTLVVGTGLCLNNAIGVTEALLGKKSGFVRTPKSGSTSTDKKQGRYRADSNFFIGVIELILGIYCFISFAIYLQTYAFVFWSSYRYLLGIFVAFYAIGLTSFGTLTLKSRFGL